MLKLLHDKTTMFKQPVKLKLITSGHYCVNLRDKSHLDGSEMQNNEDDILTVTENMTRKKRQSF